jgi:hypothetical protein
MACSSPNVMTVIKSNMRWQEHIAPYEGVEFTAEFLSELLKRLGYVNNIGADESIILK